MHILLGLLSILGIAMVWYWRARQMREAASDATDMASDIRSTGRRLLYKRRHDIHPADSIDDPRLAAAGIVVAIATMDSPISQAEIRTLTQEMRETFDIDERKALDMLSFGRWIAGQCTTEDEAVRRLAHRVARLAGPEALPDLERMIRTVATADGIELDELQLDALRIVRQVVGG